jgi:exoribonuclease R
VPAFVAAGGALDAESRRRGQTVYAPDQRTPLHPERISEDAASLLPGQVRPAFVWDMRLDADGEETSVDVYRAMVRSTERLDYAGVQQSIDGNGADEGLRLLKEIGELRIALERQRGGDNLPMPEQQVTVDDQGRYHLQFRPPVPAEDWNAQISLLTGMCAADIMLKGGLGLLRTMPSPRPEAVQALRLAAHALGLDWPDGDSVGRVLVAVDPSSPRGAAFVDQAAELMRGADYTAFDGPPPEQPDHGAVAAPYAHVTAPLRRLADRYASEACLSLAAGREVPNWVRTALPKLPGVMNSTDHKASSTQHAAVDLAEAVLLQARVGEEFEAAVLDVSAARHHHSGNVPTTGGTVAVDDPPVRARCEGTLPLGERIRVRLITADTARRLVLFSAVD